MLQFLLTCSMWANFHTHSDYCDGKGSLEDFLKSAENSKISGIGFSSHAPIRIPCRWCMKPTDLGRYLAEIEALKTTHPGIEIYKGLEVDFIPGIISPSHFSSMLDYTIGSIHFVSGYAGKHWEIDGTVATFREGLQNIFLQNIREAVTRYFELTREMILKDPPDVLGHLDKIKIQNIPDSFFEESESWYRDEIDKTLKTIKKSNIIVEVNTRGLYKKKSLTPYPSPWILERINDLQIPIMLNSDAHHPDDLIREFKSTAVLLRDIGFKKLSTFRNGIWNQVSFDEYGFDS